MELKTLFKNSSYLISARVAKFGSGILRSKLIAIYLGTLGAGIVSQLLQITTSMYRFTVLGMNDGLIKQIAESDKNEEGFDKKLTGLIKSYAFIVVLILVAAIILLMVFSKELTVYVFGDSKYYLYFLVGLVSFPILIINSISTAVLRGFKLIKYIARSELIVIIVNLVLFVPIVYFWGITGAVIHVSLSLLTVMIVNHYYADRKILLKLNIKTIDIIKSRINRSSIRELVSFAGFGLTAGIALVFTDIITRAIVVTKIGISQLGVYTPVNYWGSLFDGFISPSIITYLYPRLSEAKTDEEVTGILNDSLRFITLLFLPFLLISVPIRYEIIPLFYSKEFNSAGDYLPWHFMGVLFYLWMLMFMQAMTARGRLKTEGVMVIITCLIDIGVVYYFVSNYGLYGWMLKFIISPVIFFNFSLFYFKKNFGFRLERKNLVIMSYIVGAFVLQMGIEKFITGNYKINLLIGLILTGLSFLFLTKSEKDFAVDRVRTGYNRYIKK